MTLWASAENTVGIVVANLPLLRKPFEKLFKTIIGTTSTGTTNAADRTPNDNYNSFMMQSHRSQTARKSRVEGLPGRGTRLPSEGDSESEKGILEVPAKDERASGLFGGIMKTTKVTVHEDATGGRTNSRHAR